MENQTLWLPDGYGAGTIIKDLENNYYESIGKQVAGVNIQEIQPLEKAEAEARIKSGAKFLSSYL